MQRGADSGGDILKVLYMGGWPGGVRERVWSDVVEGMY
jgi:hypothetical protein